MVRCGRGQGADPSGSRVGEPGDRATRLCARHPGKAERRRHRKHLLAGCGHPARTGGCEQACRSNLNHTSGIPRRGPPRSNLRGNRWRAADTSRAMVARRHQFPATAMGLSGPLPQQSPAGPHPPAPAKMIDRAVGRMPPSTGRPTHPIGLVSIDLSANRRSRPPVVLMWSVMQRSCPRCTWWTTAQQRRT